MQQLRRVNGALQSTSSFSWAAPLQVCWPRTFPPIPGSNWLCAPFGELPGHGRIPLRGPKVASLGNVLLKHVLCLSFPVKRRVFINFAPSSAPFAYGTRAPTGQAGPGQRVPPHPSQPWALGKEGTWEHPLPCSVTEAQLSFQSREKEI